MINSINYSHTIKNTNNISNDNFLDYGFIFVLIIIIVLVIFFKLFKK